MAASATLCVMGQSRHVMGSPQRAPHKIMRTRAKRMKALYLSCQLIVAPWAFMATYGLHLTPGERRRVVKDFLEQCAGHRLRQLLPTQRACLWVRRQRPAGELGFRLGRTSELVRGFFLGGPNLGADAASSRWTARSAGLVQILFRCGTDIELIEERDGVAGAASYSRDSRSPRGPQEPWPFQDCKSTTERVGLDRHSFPYFCSAYAVRMYSHTIGARYCF